MIGHYGLPPGPPPDRHKWFFGLSEAVHFIEENAKNLPVEVVELHVTEKPRPLAIRLLRRLLHPSQESCLNRYAHTLWVVLRKE